MNGNKNSPCSASDHGDSIVVVCVAVVLGSRNDYLPFEAKLVSFSKFEKKTPDKWFDVANEFNIFTFARNGWCCHVIRIVQIADWYLRCKFF